VALVQVDGLDDQPRRRVLHAYSIPSSL